jgi:hypothetical protein
LLELARVTMDLNIVRELKEIDTGAQGELLALIA